MQLTKDQLQKLSEQYWRCSSVDYGDGFISALVTLGVSEEQISEITQW